MQCDMLHHLNQLCLSWLLYLQHFDRYCFRPLSGVFCTGYQDCFTDSFSCVISSVLTSCQTKLFASDESVQACFVAEVGTYFALVSQASVCVQTKSHDFEYLFSKQIGLVPHNLPTLFTPFRFLLDDAKLSKYRFKC